MNPCITSRTVTGPGLKSRPPMATYTQPTQKAIARAKGAALSQREARERAEALRLLAESGFEPQPPAPEMPTLRLQFIAERQFIQRHIAALNFLNSCPPFSSPISDWRAQA